MKRFHFLDYAKALVIFLVVSVHVGFYQLNRILLFAMPLFFFATGYSFQPAKRTLKETVSLRFQTVLVPFWIFMGFYALIEAVRAPLFGYGSREVLLPALANLLYGSGIVPIETQATAYLKQIMSYKAQTAIGVDVILPSNCHLWFLPAMFTGYVMFAAIEKRTRNSFWMNALSVAVLLLPAAAEVAFPSVCQLPYGIGRGGIGAAFMLMGFRLKERECSKPCTPRFHVITCLAAALIYAAALSLGSDGSAMVRSYYGPHGALSVAVTFIGGTAGAWLMLELCRGIEKLPLAGIKRFLSFAGQNVIVIYIFHMAVKFLLDAFYLTVLHPGEANLLDEYQMGLRPEISAPYMVLEIVLILAVCLLLAAAKSRIRNRRAAKKA